VHLLTLILLSLIISLGIHQLHNIGLEAAEVARDVGPSAGYFACLGLASAQLKRPWNWVSGGIFFAIFVIVLFTPVAVGGNTEIKFSADPAHMLAFSLGWLSSLLGQKQVRRQGENN